MFNISIFILELVHLVHQHFREFLFLSASWQLSSCLSFSTLLLRHFHGEEIRERERSSLKIRSSGGTTGVYCGLRGTAASRCPALLWSTLWSHLRHWWRTKGTSLRYQVYRFFSLYIIYSLFIWWYVYSFFVCFNYWVFLSFLVSGNLIQWIHCICFVSTNSSFQAFVFSCD